MLSTNASKIIATIVGILTLAALLAIGHHFYKDDIRTDVLTSVNNDTQTTENQAIEKAQQIDNTNSTLSDDAVNTGLQPDYRDDSESQERMQSVPGDQTQSRRYEGYEAPSITPQQSIPWALPNTFINDAKRKPLPFYGIDRCKQDWGFGDDNEIIEIKVCEQ